MTSERPNTHSERMVAGVAPSNVTDVRVSASVHTCSVNCHPTLWKTAEWVIRDQPGKTLGGGAEANKERWELKVELRGGTVGGAYC